MPIEGFVDYRRREYCNDVKCPVQMLLNEQKEGSEQYDLIRAICKSSCIHTTYEFHHWLMNRGFELVKPKNA
ncbi:MAG: hypothetical protein JSV63_02715 [Candidatus Aenigmatarchaeota archaeon]|nr:MAG: hypothetical protein JSV63_02715 [Candidatus Aenigmarchaeota archaeon]